MASDINLSRIEKENSVLFGLKWSMVGLLLALLVLSGCSSLFDERVPRYNTVEGPRRVPIYNPGGGAGQPSAQVYQQQAQQAQQVYQQPQQAVAQQPAQPRPTAMPQPRPQQPVAYQQPIQQETTLWDDITGVFDSEKEPMRPQPIPLTRKAPVTQPMQSQQMPMQATQQPQRSAMARDVEAQINALEAELNAADAYRAQVAREANQDAWPQLAPTNAVQQPALQAQPMATQPMAQPSAGYAPVKLPPPSARGSGSGYQPIMAPSNTAPMPPIITAPPSNAMANAPVRQEVQPSIDVPLAPDIGLTAPQSVNVPLSLIPPSAAGANGDYLPNSRYSGRNYMSYPNR